ncbi:TetR family transcriptional regulator C-terminal domain-containing protein [Bacillus sp. NP157]|nr:TetR family transcriptional regulator C-terminal domain-containing protein [Bacillus sp. NP157]
MPRKPNTELRRQQIVDGLLKAMAAQGYTGATIQAIAKAAGLAPGLVHYHFHDKREILVALVEQLTAYASTRFQSRAITAATAHDRLRAYIDARLAYGADANPDAVAAWVMIGAEAVRDPDVREVYQRVATAELSLIRKLLRACLVERAKRVRKLDAFAAALLAFIEGAFVLASNARSVVPAGFAADMANELVERYIAGEASTATLRKSQESRP